LTSSFSFSSTYTEAAWFPFYITSLTRRSEKESLSDRERERRRKREREKERERERKRGKQEIRGSNFKVSSK
jgi:hypothetical protein